MRCLALLFSLVLLLAVPASAVNLPATTADYIASGTLSSPGTVAVQNNGTSTVLVSMTGSGTGLTFSFQCYDGSGWIAINAYPISSGALSSPVTTGSANGDWMINSAGCAQTGNTGVRVNLTAIATGSQTIKLNASSGVGPNSVNLIPGGVVTANQGGTWTVNQGGTWTVQPGNTANTTAWKVDGSAVTQPVSQSGTWTVQPGNTANTTAWKVDGSAVTQPVNQTQIGGVAVATGNGVVGTGVGREALASDNSALPAWGHGATGSAAPAGSTYISGLSNGATGGQLTGLVVCKQHAFVHITTATDTLLVQGVASQTIRICAWTSAAAGTATWFFENTASTNANCASTLTQILGIRTEAINTGEVVSLPLGTYLPNTSGNGVCIKSTGTGGVDVDVWYAQF